jgi:serine/threonine-protein kinase RsbW
MKKFSVPVKDPFEDFIQTDNLWLTINDDKKGFSIYKKNNKSELLLCLTKTPGPFFADQEENAPNLGKLYAELGKKQPPEALLYVNPGFRKVVCAPAYGICFVLVRRHEKAVFVINGPTGQELFDEDDVLIIFDSPVEEGLAAGLKDLVLTSNKFSYVLMNEIKSLTQNAVMPLLLIDYTPHQSYKFPVKSSLKTVTLAVGMIKNKLIQYNTEKIWQIETVLHEALVNAITYGNCLDPEKQVIMNYELGIKGLRVCISDSGNGFDLDNISVPVGIEALEKISGRGIYIMKKFSDALFYNRAGTELVLFFSFN